MIQRLYNKQTEGDLFPSDFNQDELLDILRCLEDGDEYKIQNLLESDKIRHALLDSVGKGDLLDFLLDSWTPWWRPELSNGCDMLDGENPSSANGNLDERILKIPPLSRLHPNPSNLPDLQYNLLDILYAICWTLRLYHGLTNAIETGVDAGETLLKASSVMSRDARWANLSEVLSACTELSTRSLQHECNSSWSCLLHDLALICENPRYVAKALIEAIDIVKRAVTVSKEGKDDQSISRFRKSRKKLEFFLSWSREPMTIKLLAGLSGEIETWVADWQHPEISENAAGGIRRVSSVSKE